MPTRTLTTGTSNAAGSLFETAAFTPLPGRLVVVFVMSGAQPLISEAVTPTATSQQGEPFTLVATLKHPSVELTLTCFRALPTNAIGPGTLSFDFGGRRQHWCAWAVYEYDGVDPNSATVISNVTHDAVTARTRLDTGLALGDRVCVAAIALDRHAGGLAPGVGSNEIDGLQTQAPLAAGELSTLERPANAGLPSAQWTWGADANAVAIAFAITPTPSPPPDDDDVDPNEELIRQYEPILFLHPDEKFVPVDAKRYLEHSRLWSAFEKLWGGTGPRDIPRYWGQSPTNREWPRIPNAQAGQLAGMANEPGMFLGDPRFDLLHYDFCFEMGGWRDEGGVNESDVDVDTNNRYADGAEVARRYTEDADLAASKYWYHAEFFTADRLSALLSTVKRPNLLSLFRDMAMVDPVLLCYYFFFPYHDQHGLLQECTGAAKDQLVGSCGGDWACVSLLLRRPDVGLDHVPHYIGLTGEQIPLKSDDDVWSGPYGAHHFDDDDRINMNIYQWQPDLPNTTAGHPRIHVAPGSHSLSMTAGNKVGAAFPSHAQPLHCGEFDSPSLMPGPDTPSAWETLAIVVAKILALGGIGFGAGVAEIASALMGPFPDPELGTPRPTQYPAAGTGLTIKPQGLDVPDGGPAVEWRSQNGLTLNNRRYDYLVDRAEQAWWPSDPEPYYPDDPIARFRWGPPVAFDPLGRRAGMRFPDFWKMFFLGIADGQANTSFP